MTRAKISEYSATAGDNTDVNGVNIAEGCPPSSMNNMGREIMAALKRFQVGSDGDGVTVGGNLVVSGSTTANTLSATTVNATGTATFSGSVVLSGTTTANTFSTDLITEKTSAAGVTVDGVVLKDNGASLGGNLTFTGTGNRITGDLSNATFANRVAFQTSTTNSATTVYAIPNGTSTTSGFIASTDPSVTNGSEIRALATGTASTLGSYARGTGTILPLTLDVGSERMRIDTSGNVGIGTTTPTGLLHVGAGTGGIRVVFSNSAGLGKLEIPDNFAGGPSLTFGNDTDTGFLRPADNAIAVHTNGTERMRIDSNGNLLVGTTSATNNSRLKVQGSSTSGSDYCAQFTKSDGANILFLKNDGSTISDGTYNSTTANAANVFISGSAQLQRSTSSLKYKTDVQDATHGLAEVMALRPVTYKGKNDGDTVFGGLIAEEVHEAGLTEFVQYADDGSPDALAYGNMVSLCVKAIQEQQAIIESLKTRLDAAGL